MNPGDIVVMISPTEANIRRFLLLSFFSFIDFSPPIRALQFIPSSLDNVFGAVLNDSSESLVESVGKDGSL